MENNTKENSLKNHNISQYETNQTISYWDEHNKRHQADSVFNNKELKIKDLLDANPNVRNNMIDIGSGAGWLSCKLSDYFKKIIAIEPSKKAIEISKELYKDKLNIDWIEGFSEDILPTLELEKDVPMFLVTCSVFQHINNEYAEKTLKWVNEEPFVGSILSFQELFGTGGSREMHFVRTIEWWKEKLSNWSIDFHGPEVLSNVKKGIHAIKIK